MPAWQGVAYVTSTALPGGTGITYAVTHGRAVPGGIAAECWLRPPWPDDRMTNDRRGVIPSPFDTGADTPHDLARPVALPMRHGVL
jgi:hypothetical protein